MKKKKFHRSGMHLPVANLRETINYYRDVLGFHDEWTWEDKDGGIRRDDLRLLFGEDPGYVKIINTDTNRFPLIWFVDNIENIYDEYREKLDIVSALQLHPYGMWEFAFIDINGYYVRISEAVENRTT